MFELHTSRLLLPVMKGFGASRDYYIASLDISKSKGFLVCGRPEEAVPMCIHVGKAGFG